MQHLHGAPITIDGLLMCTEEDDADSNGSDMDTSGLDTSQNTTYELGAEGGASDVELGGDEYYAVSWFALFFQILLGRLIHYSLPTSSYFVSLQSRARVGSRGSMVPDDELLWVKTKVGIQFFDPGAPNIKVVDIKAAEESDDALLRYMKKRYPSSAYSDSKRRERCRNWMRSVQKAVRKAKKN